MAGATAQVGGSCRRRWWTRMSWRGEADSASRSPTPPGSAFLRPKSLPPPTGSTPARRPGPGLPPWPGRLSGDRACGQPDPPPASKSAAVRAGGGGSRRVCTWTHVSSARSATPAARTCRPGAHTGSSPRGRAGTRLHTCPGTRVWGTRKSPAERVSATRHDGPQSQPRGPRLGVAGTHGQLRHLALFPLASHSRPHFTVQGGNARPSAVLPPRALSAQDRPCHLSRGWGGDIARRQRG